MGRSIVLLLLLMPTMLYAGGGTIVFGTNHVPPFKIVEEEHFSGINAEILAEILSDMELDLEVRLCPWKRCLTELEQGRLDIFLGLFKTPDREELYHFCEPPYSVRSDKAFYVKKGRDIQIEKYEDLYDLNIGVTLGYKNFERFDSDSALQKEMVTAHLQNIRKLAVGRIDTFVQTEIAADYLIALHGYSDLLEKAKYRYQKTNPSYFVISRKSEFIDRIDEFEANLRRIRREGIVGDIKKRYLAP